MNWTQAAEEILDAMSLEDLLNEQDMSEADALALLLENGLVDFPEWFKRYNSESTED